MNYNFTVQVREALAQARVDAIALQHGRVASEHVLLGLLGDNEVVALLRALGVDPQEVRRAVEERVPLGNSTRRVGELPYTRGAKKVLEFTMAEARDRGDDHIGTEHLLLGVLREEEGVGAEVLHRFGVTRERARNIKRGPDPRPRAFRPRIDDASDRSIYEQIVAQITEAVATGDLHAGERLPTVRQLADELDVAPGTVARAYSELERERLVITEGSRGTRVAERPTPRLREMERPETLAGLLRPVAVAAFHLGANAKELQSALDEAMRGIFDKRDHAT